MLLISLISCRNCRILRAAVRPSQMNSNWSWHTEWFIRAIASPRTWLFPSLAYLSSAHPSGLVVLQYRLCHKHDAQGFGSKVALWIPAVTNHHKSQKWKDLDHKLQLNGMDATHQAKFATWVNTRILFVYFGLWYSATWGYWLLWVFAIYTVPLGWQVSF